ncbi:hypothetical protein N7493_009384 [Penicillium malachiteum]|uniref:Uncharacterized protein n=1 Tax=Penicillium malachiteum TaxID=1324776 RepID=A0AAD6HEW1_9EURO|nr:hypothetical protein N7493_009384 [Penicillium malachiteum]
MSVHSGTLNLAFGPSRIASSAYQNGPLASNHLLYLIKLITRYCYPEGNFGRNQLPDGSISLPPLYPNLTIDLHVRTAASLHQSFLWLRPIQA